MTVSTADAAPTTDQSSAKAIIQNALNQYGLGELGAWAWNKYLAGESTDQIMLELRDTDAYKARFPAMQALAKQGRAITEQQYIDYERTYAGLMHQYGMPAGFYDSPQDIANALVSGVAPTELEHRLQQAVAVSVNAPPELQAEVERLFPGQGKGHLAAIFLDPNAAVPLLDQKFAAAQIAAQADVTRFGQISTDQAMRLASLGVTQQQAAQGFSQLGQLGDVANLGVAGLDKPTTDQLLSAQFAGDSAAQQLLKRRQAQITGDFQGGTQYAGSPSSPGAGLGTAQNL